MNSRSKFSVYLPIILAIVLSLGIFIGIRISHNNKTFLLPLKLNPSTHPAGKINEVLNYIENEYVDRINRQNLVEATINMLINNLDPHSAYIPASELKAISEPLEGGFEGIGIEFSIQKDTVVVVTPVAGGPSEALGIQPCDRIIKIEGKNMAGINITNSEVMNKLRGKRGTKVNITIFRQGKFIDYTITRDKIPLHSVDAAYMITDKTGYVKISKFSKTTYDEYIKNFEKLKSSCGVSGLQNLILDLRGNGGGYLGSAILLADEFLEKGQIIVYTEGRARPKEISYATENGGFEKGKLFILVDEGSASASEIVAGAIQDNDRGTIIGRRTFGKGLVQEQAVLPDSSAIRLTVARYYTPTGRCIQKPYDSGIKDYLLEYYKRYSTGEMLSEDSIHQKDSLNYKTKGGKIVYGGGGIMPDILVPMDTAGITDYLNNIIRHGGLLQQFAFDFVDKNKKNLKSFKDFEDFDRNFSIDKILFEKFINFAEQKGVAKIEKDIAVSEELIKVELKALIAKHIFGNEGFYRIINNIDNVLQRAIELSKAPSFTSTHSDFIRKK